MKPYGWTAGLLLVLTLLVLDLGRAKAASHLQPSGMGGLRQATLNPDGTTPSEGDIQVQVVEVFYPGLSSRSACRMEMEVRNASPVQASLSTLLKTFNDDKDTVDAWLIPTGTMEPGDRITRIFSCHEAVSLEVNRESQYGWPHVCTINGEARSPCPLRLQVSTSLNIAPETGGAATP
jgi:hypothetical protein